MLRLLNMKSQNVVEAAHVCNIALILLACLHMFPHSQLSFFAVVGLISPFMIDIYANQRTVTVN